MNTQKNILIVDDDKNILLTFKMALTASGHNVTTTHLPAEALSLVQRDKPDLLIVDNRMPGTTGVEIIQELRSIGDDTPVILMSATPSVTHEFPAAVQKNLTYEPKPVTPQRLREVVAKQIEEAYGTLLPN